MSRATHARFLARQARRRRDAAQREAAARQCARCGAPGAKRYVADDDPLGMWGAVWLCALHAPAEGGDQ